jgi:hypothetical protein
LMSYRVENEADHEESDGITLCSTNDSIGYVAMSGETVFWSGIELDSWDEWRALPHYTTNYDAALRLKSSVLGFGRTVVVEETEIPVSVDDGSTEITTIFRAGVHDADGRIIGGPPSDRAAVAVLAAMLDYLLTVGGEIEESERTAP